MARDLQTSFAYDTLELRDQMAALLAARQRAHVPGNGRKPSRQGLVCEALRMLLAATRAEWINDYEHEKAMRERDRY